MRVLNEPPVKLFENFPLLFASQKVSKEQRMLREFILLNHAGMFQLCYPDCYESMEKEGEMVACLVLEGNAWFDLDDMCKFMQTPKHRLISLN